MDCVEAQNHREKQTTLVPILKSTKECTIGTRFKDSSLSVCYCLCKKELHAGYELWNDCVLKEILLYKKD